MPRPRSLLVLLIAVTSPVGSAAAVPLPARAALASPTPVVVEPPPLFGDAAPVAHQPGTYAVSVDAVALRARLVSAGRAGPDSPSAPGCDARTPRPLTVEIPGGRLVTVARAVAWECTTPGGARELSWHSVPDVAGREAVSLGLATRTRPDGSAVVAGVLQSREGAWELVASPGGDSFALEAIDTATDPDHAPDVEPDPAPAGDVVPEAPPEPPLQDPIPRGGSKVARLIDVLFVHASNVNAARAELAVLQQVTTANQVFSNSGLAIGIRAVGTRAVVYQQGPTMGIDKQRLELPGEGSMDEVHPWRDDLDADLVVLLVGAPSDACGVAPSVGSAKGSDANAFLVIGLDTGCESTTLAHEGGHVLGSMHNPEDAVKDGRLQRGSFPWAYGHIVDGVARDIMGYTLHCTRGCPTDLQYADPDQDFIRRPGVRSGTPTRDADKAIDDTAWAVAQYRPVRSSNDVIRFGRADRSFDPFVVNADPTWTPNLPGSAHDVEARYVSASGDFDGNGRSDLLWYYDEDGSQPDSIWFFDRSLGGRGRYTVGARDLPGGLRVAAGDFDGDGIDDLLMHAPGSATDRIWWGVERVGGAKIGDAETVLTVSGNYFPVVGDFDADGADDVLWYAPGPAADTVWWGGSRAGMGSQSMALGINGLYLPVVGDFQGDRADDIVWYGPGSVADSIWWGVDGARALGQRQRSISVSGQYRPVAGNLDGSADGAVDIFWHGPGDGADTVWWGGSETSFGTGSTSAPAPGDHHPVAGDLDGDGRDDLYLFTWG